MVKAFVFFFFYVAIAFARPLELDINAQNAILINAESGAILFEKESKKKVYPASLTKLFSIWYILENYQDSLTNTYPASKDALSVVVPEKKFTSVSLKPYVLETDGTSFDLIQGEKLTLLDLLHGMMIVSGNDASNVVAENVSGSIDTFMNNMNAFILNKGILDTYLCNPHGLHMPDHSSTALDISNMLKYAIKNPDFLTVFTCKFYIRPKTNKQNKKELVTYNKLLKPGDYFYQHAVGSKTGYTSKAKYNLASVAKKDDRTLIAVLLGSSNPDVRFEDTKKLFNQAFLEKKQIKKVIDKEKIFLAKISKTSKVLKASLKRDLNIEYFPAEEEHLNAFVIYDDLKAPIKKGQKVASLEIKTDKGKVVKKENLYAIENISRSFFSFLKDLFVKS